MGEPSNEIFMPLVQTMSHVFRNTGPIGPIGPIGPTGIVGNVIPMNKRFIIWRPTRPFCPTKRFKHGRYYGSKQPYR